VRAALQLFKLAERDSHGADLSRTANRVTLHKRKAPNHRWFGAR
jgi:hypothetical protein